ncbi:hypothetical protein LXM94_25025 [Rhizobium sp. TRM95111]|uniref:hypothetical protein n=1 Tax=Rhizobium alarense TaxID=2846851 RepID=UPI001F246915|nr:hypothetical protein [Rhizobium alarense]MCF3643225.1 hypothetical protein [Rhizobium alarense]
MGVARALLVEGAPIAETASAHSMTTKQARVLQSRFIEKAEQYRLRTFMQREPPKLSASALEPFSGEVRTLRDKGYTVVQIVAYFKQNGVTTSPTTVRKFLRSIRA